MSARRRSIANAIKTAIKETGGDSTYRYERDVDGDTLTCDIIPGLATTAFEMVEETSQVVTTVHSQDFFFPSADLVFPETINLFSQCCETGLWRLMETATNSSTWFWTTTACLAGVTWTLTETLFAFTPN